jgi:hypothetical protein
MKTIEKLFQETEIHFLLQNEGEVMVNATEMASLFGKYPKDFTRLEGTQRFINELLEQENEKLIVAHLLQYPDQSKEKNDCVLLREEDLIYTNKKAGTFMTRKLALKFAAWLDVKFDVWIIDQIDNILFGHYKKHWEAHATQEEAKINMENLKNKLLKSGGTDEALAYFEAERSFNDAKTAKSRAIRNQLKMFSE